MLNLTHPVSKHTMVVLPFHIQLEHLVVHLTLLFLVQHTVEMPVLVGDQMKQFTCHSILVHFMNQNVIYGLI